MENEIERYVKLFLLLGEIKKQNKEIKRRIEAIELKLNEKKGNN